MARYNMPKPLSMYRDTGLVEITQEFRNRYVQNMAADNALAQAVLEMDSMEEDQEAKRKLIDKYNTQLQQRSESGNYHLLGHSVVKDAQNFRKDYQPIKQSKENYDTWLKGLTEQRDAFIKTGKGVDPFTYNAKIAEAKYNYDGIQYGADGSVDDSSLFNGPGYVGYVDVESRIIKHMKDVVLSEIDTTGMETPLDKNMQIIQGFNEETQSPAYYVKQGNYQKWLDPELVRSVVTSVLNQPDSKAYNYQTSYLENFTKDRVNTDSGVSIATEEVNSILGKLENDINDLETKKPKNKKEREEIEAALETKELIEEFILEQRQGGINDLNILINLNAHNREASYIQNAVTKYAGVKSQKFVRDYTEGSRYTQSLKDPLPTIKYRVGADGFQVEVLGGTDMKSKKEFYDESTNAISAYQETYGKTFLELAQEASSAEDYDNLVKASGGAITADRAKSIAREIQYHARNAELIEVQMREAYTALGTTEEEYGVMLDQEFKNVSSKRKMESGGTHVVELQEVLGEIMGTNYDAVTTLQMLSVNENNIREKVVEAIYNKRGEQISTLFGGKGDAVVNLNQSISELTSKLDNRIAADKKKMDEFLDPGKLVGITDAVIMGSFNDPTGKTTKHIRNLIEEGLPQNFELIDKKGNETTYNKLVESEEDFWTIGDKPPTVVKAQIGLVHVPRVDGTAMLIIPFKNEEGDILTYYAKASQIQAPALDKYVNSMQFKVRSIYRQGLHANIRGQWAPEVFEGSVVFDYATNKIYINGVEQNGIEEGLREIEGFLTKSGQDI